MKQTRCDHTIIRCDNERSPCGWQLRFTFADEEVDRCTLIQHGGHDASRSHLQMGKP
jgi:hypothetical protein